MYITIWLIYPVQRGEKRKIQKWEWGDDGQAWARREVTEEDADESRDVGSRRMETRHWLHVVKVQNAWCRGSKSPDKSHAPRAHQYGRLKKRRWKWWCFCPQPPQSLNTESGDQAHPSEVCKGSGKHGALEAENPTRGRGGSWELCYLCSFQWAKEPLRMSTLKVIISGCLPLAIVLRLNEIMSENPLCKLKVPHWRMTRLFPQSI